METPNLTLARPEYCGQAVVGKSRYFAHGRAWTVGESIHFGHGLPVVRDDETGLELVLTRDRSHSLNDSIDSLNRLIVEVLPRMMDNDTRSVDRTAA